MKLTEAKEKWCPIPGDRPFEKPCSCCGGDIHSPPDNLQHVSRYCLADGCALWVWETEKGGWVVSGNEVHHVDGGASTTHGHCALRRS